MPGSCFWEYRLVAVTVAVADISHRPKILLFAGEEEGTPRTQGEVVERVLYYLVIPVSAKVKTLPA